MLDDVAILSCGPAPAPYFAPSAPAPSLSCVAFLQWALLSLLSCGTKRRDHGTKVQQNNKQEEIVGHGPPIRRAECPSKTQLRFRDAGWPDTR